MPRCYLNFLPAAANVTNITVQNQCVLDGSDHLEIAADPIALADMLNALDPSRARSGDRSGHRSRAASCRVRTSQRTAGSSLRLGCQ
jgi:hypothetical protein